MRDRVRELLDFDLMLLDSIVRGRLSLSLEDVAHPLPRPSPPVRFVGFDEAGRGALAGPVVVACVHIDVFRSPSSPGFDRERLSKALAGLDDSKRVTQRRREALHAAIVSESDWGVGCASALEIDRRGIVTACRLAARRASASLPVEADVGLFDRGLSVAGGETATSFAELELTRGDGRSLHIAAASILAKVARDAIMVRLAQRFPGYSLAQHKGYGTAAHREAIRRLGPSPIHRRSFCTRIETVEIQSC